MGAFRRQRYLIAWIAIFGLITNLAVAALCCEPAKAPAGPDLVDTSATCLHHDDAVPQQVDQGNAPQPVAKPCPLCVATAAVALALAIGALLGLFAIAARTRFAFDFVNVSSDDLRRAGLGSRAPPLPA
jgi:hypothetical protein